ncbi:hypothetical protein ACU8KH_04177 [Lachancea thermotolerans]
MSVWARAAHNSTSFFLPKTTILAGFDENSNNLEDGTQDKLESIIAL